MIALGRGKQRLVLLLLAEALLLGAGALCYGLGSPQLAVAGIVLAMGLEDACSRSTVASGSAFMSAIVAMSTRALRH
jgi:hypothetical protein